MCQAKVGNTRGKKLLKRLRHAEKWELNMNLLKRGKQEEVKEKGKCICKCLSDHFPNFVLHYLYNATYEIKRCLLLGRKVMTNIDSVLKSRDITLPTKVPRVKVIVFPVVMYGCKSWTIKKVEHRRTDTFELWCWGRLLRVPWIARRSDQSNLNKISPEYSSEGLMLKLKLQYFGHLMWRADSLEKTLMLGKIEGRRRRGWQRMK